MTTDNMKLSVKSLSVPLFFIFVFVASVIVGYSNDKKYFEHCTSVSPIQPSDTAFCRNMGGFRFAPNYTLHVGQAFEAQDWFRSFVSMSGWGLLPAIGTIFSIFWLILFALGGTPRAANENNKNESNGITK